VAETVRVIRGEQAGTYVAAEEHGDGSLLLRPDDPYRASERRPERAVAAKSEATDAAGPHPGAILEVRRSGEVS
jgi:hypothetical protein